jgi:UDP-glucuronate 4-epimerase
MLLVTGGAGFIGSHLCDRLLAKEHHVLCLDNFSVFYDPALKELNISQAAKNSNFVLVRGDILDEALLEQLFSQYEIDKVIHLAAMAGVRSSISSPAK